MKAFNGRVKSPAKDRVKNYNKGMTMNGQPIIVPSSPKFKPAPAFNVPEDVLFYAFRYALGRRTYAVADVASELRAHASTLSNKTKLLIIKEIEEADMKPEGLGMDMDRKEWLRVIDTFKGKKPLEAED